MLSWLGLPAAGMAQSSVDFNRDIRPILAENCFACHGPDEEHRVTDLRFDQAGGFEAAVDADDAESSDLYQRLISDDESMRMPPADSLKVLKPEQIELLKRWIESGARYETHWSFTAPQKLDVPHSQSNSPANPPKNPTEIVNPIDAFLLEELQARDLKFAPEADKRTLIRRVAFTLTGLPPRPTEVARFLADQSPQAYEAMVDRYLASASYGEEMARHWLDLARYGDTHGMHLDNERQMWAYRDWVVRSFNRNQPFNEFTIDQLAGDLVPEPTTDQMIATGFNRCNVTTGEGGAINEEFRYRYAVDRTNTAMQIWTGLTAECAACHDHKFDPISIKEYYSLYAFFNSAADPAMDGNALLTQPVVSTATDEQKSRIEELKIQLDQKNQALDQLAGDYQYRDPAHANPAPPTEEKELVLFDEEFPAHGTTFHLGSPTSIVSAPANVPIFSGQRSLKRKAAGLEQDVFHESSKPFAVPANGKIQTEVWLDPEDKPKAIMLQFFKDGWNHRCVWGDYDMIEWGKKDTPERVHLGELPETGRWVHLEIEAKTLGLNPGDQLKGFAFTQYGGTVYWDLLKISGHINPAKDPGRSFHAWWKTHQSNPPASLPDALKQIIVKAPVSEHASKDGAEKKADEAVNAAKKEATPDSNTETAAASPPEDQPTPEQVRQLLSHWLKYECVSAKAEFAPALEAVEKLKNELAEFEKSIPQTFVYQDLPQAQDSFVMKRGQYNSPGEKVTPNVPAFLPELKPVNPERPNRLDLAVWLLSPEHPLTSRVIVNRFWQQIFGTGLVKSSGDFGSQGESPSHPRLLDFLAFHFREKGWDVKQLVRLMVTSQAFKQQSAISPELLELDPENRLLARGTRFRLGAEQIRDNALFVSGLIRLEMGGRGVNFYQPPNVWEPVGYIDSNTRNYKQDSGPALYRRSLYTFFKRTAPPPFMGNFDGPNREQICTKRDRSNTPLQALQLMNDVQHVEAARALAERIMVEGGTEFGERLRFAYEVVLSRPPREEEVSILQSLFAALLKRYEAAPDEARKLISAGESIPRENLQAPELAALTMLANTLLNLDETLNRN
jgi:hypothetical protein